MEPPMVGPTPLAHVFELVPMGVAALVALDDGRTPVVPLVTMADRDDQLAMTLALVVLLRTTVLDLLAASDGRVEMGDYLHDLGLRAARRAEGWRNHPSAGR